MLDYLPWLGACLQPACRVCSSLQLSDLVKRPSSSWPSILQSCVLLSTSLHAGRHRHRSLRVSFLMPSLLQLGHRHAWLGSLYLSVQRQSRQSVSAASWPVTSDSDAHCAPAQAAPAALPLSRCDLAARAASAPLLHKTRAAGPHARLVASCSQRAMLGSGALTQQAHASSVDS